MRGGRQKTLPAVPGEGNSLPAHISGRETGAAGGAVKTSEYAWEEYVLSCVCLLVRTKGSRKEGADHERNVRIGESAQKRSALPKSELMEVIHTWHVLQV